jgi:hypothetical protein
MIHVAHLFYTMNTYGQPITPALLARWGKLFTNPLFPGVPGEQPGVLQMGDLDFLGFTPGAPVISSPSAFVLQADVPLVTKASFPTCPPNAVGCLPSGETNFPTYTSVEYALSELYTASLSLGMPGVAVASGPSVTPVPAPWSAVTTYATGDEVSYLGPNYLALQASTNRVPDASPLFWQIAAPFPT